MGLVLLASPVYFYPKCSFPILYKRTAAFLKLCLFLVETTKKNFKK